jgi:pyridoxamine 5'-phosphate oxidase
MKNFIRTDYNMSPLSESEINSDPVVQFSKWMKNALATDIIEPTAMILATSGSNGLPSSRMVLLKDYSASGFVFYTNYESRKGKELLTNPQAALVFWWGVLHRQVRIEGKVEKVTDQESDEYFYSRPRGSQIGAWASRQSKIIRDYSELEKDYRKLENKFMNKPVPRPSFWGGFRVIPSRIEFWQGRPNRLHDRLCYFKQKSGKWIISRLSP